MEKPKPKKKYEKAKELEQYGIKQKGLFDHLNNILYHKDTKYFDNLTETERKDFNIYIIQRFISMDSLLTELVAYVDKFAMTILDKRMYHNFMLELVPKRSFGSYHINYIKKKDEEKVPKWMIALIRTRFDVSASEAEEYYNIMKEEERVEILHLYGVEYKKYKELGIEPPKGPKLHKLIVEEPVAKKKGMFF